MARSQGGSFLPPFSFFVRKLTKGLWRPDEVSPLQPGKRTSTELRSTSESAARFVTAGQI